MQRYRTSLFYEAQKFLLVSCGAVPGALIRWNISNELAVNFIGTFILGFVIGLDLRAPFKLLIGVGFCGALTTFSSWIIHCFQLIVNGNFLEALYLIIFPVIIGLCVAWMGYGIGSKLKLLSL